MTRRGIALLLVLGTILMITTALSASLLATVNSRMSDVLHRAEQRAADLFSASETITDRWLRTESARAVVAPSASEPRIEVTDINWPSDDMDLRVRLTAWDLLGMPPAGIPTSHPLSSVVPNGIEASDANSLKELSDPLHPVHPDPDVDTARLGGFLAVHPRDLRHKQSQVIVININSAPEYLLQAAMRTAQRGDLATILASRSRGIPAPAPVNKSDIDSFVALTARSNLWAVRADITAGPVTRSWWTVYESRGRGWSIIDRHEISE